MAMNPQDKTELTKYTLVAKKIIYDAQRMKQFMQMLGSKQGAMTAVQTVMAMIEKVRPIPPALAPLLGVNVYMLMVDIAQEFTGHAPDPAIIKDVIGTILSTVQKSHGQAAGAPPRQPTAQQPGGLIQQPMGVPA
jgi:hypothetical protein